MVKLLLIQLVVVVILTIGSVDAAQSDNTEEQAVFEERQQTENVDAEEVLEERQQTESEDGKEILEERQQTENKEAEELLEERSQTENEDDEEFLEERSQAENEDDEEVLEERSQAENEDDEEFLEERSQAENEDDEESLEERSQAENEDKDVVLEERSQTQDEEAEELLEERQQADNKLNDDELLVERQQKDNEVLEERQSGHSGHFRLVNSRGHRITPRSHQQRALLLYNGGTVCDDGFSTNSAHAICRVMGFRHAAHWTHGQVYGTMQSRKRIALDDVICRSSTWSSCHYTTRHNCRHHEDILLTCVPRPRPINTRLFSLVNCRGHRITPHSSRQQGLLLYHGGTVCDDGFSTNSAHAICRVMGFRHAARWTHGQVYGALQTRKRIALDDVICRSSTWSSCRYRTRHNCNHHEDILLTCVPRAINSRGFMLVNSGGHRIAHPNRLGLLLYRGGTVCDDYFSNNSGHAICRLMGFHGARSWTHGYRFRNIQRRKRITLDDVRCRTSSWSSCRYSTRHNCGHNEDIFLNCR